MSASSGTLRTYGKRPKAKRKNASDAEETSKRRKVSEDPVIRTPSPSRTDTDDTYAEFVEGSSTPLKSRVPKPYGTPSGTLVRDLSGIFDSMSPASPSKGSGIKSPVPSPTKLAKRMLGRSKTESSVESHSPKTKEHTGIDRTSSMPNLPSSSSSAAPTPDRLSSNGNGNSALSLSRPAILPTGASSTTRTYAGKYRSFLMALPASSSGSTLSKGLPNDDEFETRESYSSLRSRWGVDNSEDDPMPTYDIYSPAASTPEGSPARSGNVKGKTAIRTVQVPNGMMNPLKSITELRNKGESRRFLDEVGYLFEGLDPKCSIVLRRSSALEITTKLCDPEFTRKAKAADFFARTWELFLLAGAGKCEDKILDILLVLLLALIARDPASLAELAGRPLSPSMLTEDSQNQNGTSPVDILIQILENLSSDGDLLTLSDQNSRLDGQHARQPSVPKKDRAILSSIHKIVSSKSNLFPPSTPISIPLLITSTLQTLPPSLFPISCLPTLLTSLRRCISNSDTEADRDASSSTATLYAALSSEASWPDVVEAIPYESVYHHLRLFDAYLVGQWTAIGNETDPNQERHLGKEGDEWMVRDLIALAVCCEVKIRNSQSEGRDSDDDLLNGPHQRCFALTLRVLISLTHNDTGWAEGVLGCKLTMGLILRMVWKAGNEFRRFRDGKDEDEETEEEDDEEEKDVIEGPQAFDTLCLVLGLLTNLVQVVDDAKNVVRRSRLNPSCSLRNQACAKRCICSQKPRPKQEEGNEWSGVEVLVRLYEQLQREQGRGEPQGGIRHQGFHLRNNGNDDPSPERSQQKEQENEAQTSFLCGHLSVLFGLLMMGSSGLKNRDAILMCPSSRSPLRSTPKRERKGRRRRDDEDSDDSSTKTKTRLMLDRLADQAREFGTFYTVVSRRMGAHGWRYGGSGDGTRGKGEKGEEECEGGGGGSRVVKGVVEFLEGLRDGQ